MGTNIKLTASDGHTLDAYRADPEGAPKGGIVVIQEIFGVNRHIRDVADRFAADGYAAVAPALFDRAKTGVELDYNEEGIVEGREIAFPMGFETPILDIEAAVKALSDTGAVGTVGYCWGGSLSYLSACRLPIACAVGYYGGQIVAMLENDPGDRPKVPAILHFGNQDASIPLDDVEKVRAANPDLPIYMYDAGHGFNCDRRGSWDEPASTLARERTLALFAEHIG